VRAAPRPRRRGGSRPRRGVASGGREQAGVRESDGLRCPGALGPTRTPAAWSEGPLEAVRAARGVGASDARASSGGRSSGRPGSRGHRAGVSTRRDPAPPGQAPRVLPGGRLRVGGHLRNRAAPPRRRIGGGPGPGLHEDVRAARGPQDQSGSLHGLVRQRPRRERGHHARGAGTADPRLHDAPAPGVRRGPRAGHAGGGVAPEAIRLAHRSGRGDGRAQRPIPDSRVQPWGFGGRRSSRGGTGRRMEDDP
jgi:hypothetical protein